MGPCRYIDSHNLEPFMCLERLILELFMYLDRHNLEPFMYLDRLILEPFIYLDRSNLEPFMCFESLIFDHKLPTLPHPRKYSKNKGQIKTNCFILMLIRSFA